MLREYDFVDRHISFINPLSPLGNRLHQNPTHGEYYLAAPGGYLPDELSGVGGVARLASRYVFFAVRKRMFLGFVLQPHGATLFLANVLVPCRHEFVFI